ncbi:hypothetical protein C8J56DRAFT_249227 [Mycena floridula]|nr:hypothetical protein C8J56DRAFT_249227 [Mycena floridula]
MSQPRLYHGQFPQEIIDEIIGFHFADPAALSACSLVRRNWMVPTRHHLFTKVVIKNDERGQKLLELARDRHATFLGAISLIEFGWAHCFVILDALEGSLVRKPKQVWSLSLNGSILPKDIFAWRDMPIILGISRLDLHGNVPFASFPGMCLFISFFTSLEALEVSNIRFSPHQPPLSMSADPISSSLTRLSIRILGDPILNQMFADWIMTSSTAPTLLHLSTEWQLIPFLTRLIRRHLPKLHLSNFQFTDTESLQAGAGELLTIPAIEAIQFHLEEEHGSADIIQSVISKMPKLKSVTIIARLDMCSADEWASRSAQFERFFTSLKPLKLQFIFIKSGDQYIYNTMNTAESIRLIQLNMPQLQTQGNLAFMEAVDYFHPVEYGLGDTMLGSNFRATVLT